MTIDRPNLADAFKARPTERATGLSGLLPDTRPQRSPRPTEQPVAQTMPAEATTTSVTETPTPEPAPTTASRKPAVAKARASEQANIVTNVAVYLEPDLHAVVREQRRLSGFSYDELISNAFASVSDDDLVHYFQPTTRPAAIPGGMPIRQRRVRGTAGIQVQLRLDTNQRTWMQQKQDAVGAPSRSALAAAVLRLHLIGSRSEATDS